MYFHRVDDSQETDVIFILFIIFKYPSIHPVQAHGMLEPIPADTGLWTGCKVMDLQGQHTKTSK